MIFLSFMNLFRNVRRTIAVLLTVALGTGVLFSFSGFIHGVLEQYKDNTIHAHYGHGQINTRDYRENVYAEPWNHWIDRESEINAYLLAQPEVQQLFPRITFSALLKNGSVTFSGIGQGIDAKEEAQFFHGLNVEQGHQLKDEADGILLGKGLAKALGVDVGDAVTLLVNATDGTLGQSTLTVTGIFHTGSLDFDSRMFRIQLNEAKNLLKTSKIEMISLGLSSDLAWDSFKEKFEKAFPEFDATSFAVLDKVYYQHSVNWLNAQFSVIQIIILSIVLLGIFNSISAAILERKQEIGNFRANGESIKDILKLITLEGTFLGFFGSALGLAFAFTVMKLFLDQGIEMPPGPGLTRPFFISFKFEWEMVYNAMILSVTASIFASFLAGIRVAKMPIAKALRSY